MFIVKLFKKLIGLIIGVAIVVLVLDFFLNEDDSIVSTVVENVSDSDDDYYYDDDYEYDSDYDYDYDNDDYDYDNYYEHGNHENYDNYSEHGTHNNNNTHHGNQGHYVDYNDYGGYGDYDNYDYQDYGNYQNHSYSDYDDYDEDSWEVIDYLFSFIGDDYGYDNYDYSDYDHYYNYNDYYNDYQYDYDYDYDNNDYGYEYDNDDSYYYGEKPSVTTSSSGNNSNQTQDVVPVSVSTQRQRFIEYALSLKGTPYLYGGKTPSPGIDCSGLVAFAARKAISVNFTGSAQMMYDAANNININSAEPGDLLFFSDTGNGITHVGIFLGKNNGQNASNQRMMVHSASDGASTGVIVSSIDQSNYWSKHLVGAKSFLSSSSEVRNITRSKNKKSIKSSSESDFENDSWWDDVDASWFD